MVRFRCHQARPQRTTMAEQCGSLHPICRGCVGYGELQASGCEVADTGLTRFGASDGADEPGTELDNGTDQRGYEGCVLGIDSDLLDLGRQWRLLRPRRPAFA